MIVPTGRYVSAAAGTPTIQSNLLVLSYHPSVTITCTSEVSSGTNWYDGTELICEADFADLIYDFNDAYLSAVSDPGNEDLWIWVEWGGSYQSHYGASAYEYYRSVIGFRVGAYAADGDNVVVTLAAGSATNAAGHAALGTSTLVQWEPPSATSTPDPTPSITPSISLSSTMTPSVTTSVTATTSVSPTWTTSPSGTTSTTATTSVSPTWTASPSDTTSVTVTTTPSPTLTASPSATTSATTTATTSSTESPSPTATASASPGPVPVHRFDLVGQWGEYITGTVPTFTFGTQYTMYIEVPSEWNAVANATMSGTNCEFVGVMMGLGASGGTTLWAQNCVPIDVMTANVWVNAGMFSRVVAGSTMYSAASTASWLFQSLYVDYYCDTPEMLFATPIGSVDVPFLWHTNGTVTCHALSNWDLGDLALAARVTRMNDSVEVPVTALPSERIPETDGNLVKYETVFTFAPPVGADVNITLCADADHRTTEVGSSMQYFLPSWWRASFAVAPPSVTVTPAAISAGSPTFTVEMATSAGVTGNFTGSAGAIASAMTGSTTCTVDVESVARMSDGSAAWFICSGAGTPQTTRHQVVVDAPVYHPTGITTAGQTALAGMATNSFLRLSLSILVIWRPTPTLIIRDVDSGAGLSDNTYNGVFRVDVGFAEDVEPGDVDPAWNITVAWELDNDVTFSTVNLTVLTPEEYAGEGEFTAVWRAFVDTGNFDDTLVVTVGDGIASSPSLGGLLNFNSLPVTQTVTWIPASATPTPSVSSTTSMTPSASPTPAPFMGCTINAVTQDFVDVEGEPVSGVSAGKQITLFMEFDRGVELAEGVDVRIVVEPSGACTGGSPIPVPSTDQTEWRWKCDVAHGVPVFSAAVAEGAFQEVETARMVLASGVIGVFVAPGIETYEATTLDVYRLASGAYVAGQQAIVYNGESESGWTGVYGVRGPLTVNAWDVSAAVQVYLVPTDYTYDGTVPAENNWAPDVTGWTAMNATSVSLLQEGEATWSYLTVHVDVPTNLSFCVGINTGATPTLFSVGSLLPLLPNITCVAALARFQSGAIAVSMPTVTSLVSSVSPTVSCDMPTTVFEGVPINATIAPVSDSAILDLVTTNNCVVVPGTLTRTGATTLAFTCDITTIGDDVTVTASRELCITNAIYTSDIIFALVPNTGEFLRAIPRIPVLSGGARVAQIVPRAVILARSETATANGRHDCTRVFVTVGFPSAVSGLTVDDVWITHAGSGFNVTARDDAVIVTQTAVPTFMAVGVPMDHTVATFSFNPAYEEWCGDYRIVVLQGSVADADSAIPNVASMLMVTYEEPSATSTPSPSETPSVTSTRSPSVSPTTSRTESGSPTAAPTASATTTFTPTMSITPTFTPSPSVTTSATTSPTITGSATVTVSVTPSSSPSPSLAPLHLTISVGAETGLSRGFNLLFALTFSEPVIRNATTPWGDDDASALMGVTSLSEQMVLVNCTLSMYDGVLWVTPVSALVGCEPTAGTTGAGFVIGGGAFVAVATGVRSNAAMLTVSFSPAAVLTTTGEGALPNLSHFGGTEALQLHLQFDGLVSNCSVDAMEARVYVDAAPLSDVRDVALVSETVSERWIGEYSFLRTSLNLTLDTAGVASDIVFTMPTGTCLDAASGAPSRRQSWRIYRVSATPTPSPTPSQTPTQTPTPSATPSASPSATPWAPTITVIGNAPEMAGDTWFTETFPRSVSTILTFLVTVPPGTVPPLTEISVWGVLVTEGCSDTTIQTESPAWSATAANVTCTVWPGAPRVAIRTLSGVFTLHGEGGTPGGSSPQVELYNRPVAMLEASADAFSATPNVFTRPGNVTLMLTTSLTLGIEAATNLTTLVASVLEVRNRVTGVRLYPEVTLVSEGGVVDDPASFDDDYDVHGSVFVVVLDAAGSVLTSDFEVRMIDSSLATDTGRGVVSSQWLAVRHVTSPAVTPAMYTAFSGSDVMGISLLSSGIIEPWEGYGWSDDDIVNSLILTGCAYLSGTLFRVSDHHLALRCLRRADEYTSDDEVIVTVPAGVFNVTVTSTVNGVPSASGTPGNLGIVTAMVPCPTDETLVAQFTVTPVITARSATVSRDGVHDGTLLTVTVVFRGIVVDLEAGDLQVFQGVLGVAGPEPFNVTVDTVGRASRLVALVEPGGYTGALILFMATGACFDASTEAASQPAVLRVTWEMPSTTPTPTVSLTSTVSPSVSPSMSPTVSSTATMTAIPSITSTPTPSVSPSPSGSALPMPIEATVGFMDVDSAAWLIFGTVTFSRPVGAAPDVDAFLTTNCDIVGDVTMWTSTVAMFYCLIQSDMSTVTIQLDGGAVTDAWNMTNVASPLAILGALPVVTIDVHSATSPAGTYDGTTVFMTFTWNLAVAGFEIDDIVVTAADGAALNVSNMVATTPGTVFTAEVNTEALQYLDVGTTLLVTIVPGAAISFALETVNEVTRRAVLWTTPLPSPSSTPSPTASATYILPSTSPTPSVSITATPSPQPIIATLTSTVDIVRVPVTAVLLSFSVPIATLPMSDDFVTTNCDIDDSALVIIEAQRVFLLTCAVANPAQGILMQSRANAFVALRDANETARIVSLSVPWAPRASLAMMNRDPPAPTYSGWNDTVRITWPVDVTGLTTDDVVFTWRFDRYTFNTDGNVSVGTTTAWGVTEVVPARVFDVLFEAPVWEASNRTESGLFPVLRVGVRTNATMSNASGTLVPSVASVLDLMYRRESVSPSPSPTVSASPSVSSSSSETTTTSRTASVSPSPHPSPSMAPFVTVAVTAPTTPHDGVSLLVVHFSFSEPSVCRGGIPMALECVYANNANVVSFVCDTALVCTLVVTPRDTDATIEVIINGDDITGNTTGRTTVFRLGAEDPSGLLVVTIPPGAASARVFPAHPASVAQYRWTHDGGAFPVIIQFSRPVLNVTSTGLFVQGGQVLGPLIALVDSGMPTVTHEPLPTFPPGDPIVPRAFPANTLWLAYILPWFVTNTSNIDQVLDLPLRLQVRARAGVAVNTSFASTPSAVVQFHFATSIGEMEAFVTAGMNPHVPVGRTPVMPPAPVATWSPDMVSNGVAVCWTRHARAETAPAYTCGNLSVLATGSHLGGARVSANIWAPDSPGFVRNATQHLYSATPCDDAGYREGYWGASVSAVSRVFLALNASAPSLLVGPVMWQGAESSAPPLVPLLRADHELINRTMHRGGMSATMCMVFSVETWNGTNQTCATDGVDHLRVHTAVTAVHRTGASSSVDAADDAVFEAHALPVPVFTMARSSPSLGRLSVLSAARTRAVFADGDTLPTFDLAVAGPNYTVPIVLWLPCGPLGMSTVGGAVTLDLFAALHAYASTAFLPLNNTNTTTFYDVTSAFPDGVPGTDPRPSFTDDVVGLVGQTLATFPVVTAVTFNETACGASRAAYRVLVVSVLATRTSPDSRPLRGWFDAEDTRALTGRSCQALGSETPSSTRLPSDHTRPTVPLYVNFNFSVGDFINTANLRAPRAPPQGSYMSVHNGGVHLSLDVGVPFVMERPGGRSGPDVQQVKHLLTVISIGAPPPASAFTTSNATRAFDGMCATVSSRFFDAILNNFGYDGPRHAADAPSAVFGSGAAYPNTTIGAAALARSVPHLFPYLPASFGATVFVDNATFIVVPANDSDTTGPCRPGLDGDTATTACAVYTLRALPEQLLACRNFDGTPAVLRNEPTVYGAGLITTVSFSVHVTRYTAVEAGPFPVLSPFTTSQRSIVASVTTGTMGAPAMAAWSAPMPVDFPVYVSLSALSKEACPRSECNDTNRGQAPEFSCTCGSLGVCPPHASYARYTQVVQVLIPRDPAGEVGILDTVVPTEPPSGAPYGVEWRHGYSSVAHFDLSFANGFLVRYATSCLSEFNVTAGVNSRFAFASAQGQADNFDVAVAMGRIVPEDGNWSQVAGGTVPRSLVTPLGSAPLTLHITARAVLPIMDTYLANETLPGGIAFVGAPTRYAWPVLSDNASDVVVPLSSTALADDIVLVVALNSSVQRARLSLMIHSVTACELNPVSPFVDCVLGTNASDAFVALVPQLACPSSELAGSCDAARWANHSSALLPSPVLGATPLVRAFAPVTSSGVTVADLCRFSRLTATTRRAAGSPSFLCPVAPDDRTGSYCGAATSVINGTAVTWPREWGILPGVNGTMPGIDAYRARLSAAIPATAVFLMDTVVTACGNVPGGSGSRRLRLVAARRVLAANSSDEVYSIASAVTQVIVLVDVYGDRAVPADDTVPLSVWLMALVGVGALSVCMFGGCCIWRKHNQRDRKQVYTAVAPQDASATFGVGAVDPARFSNAPNDRAVGFSPMTVRSSQ